MSFISKYAIICGTSGFSNSSGVISHTKLEPKKKTPGTTRPVYPASEWMPSIA
jgi:hypothetical protein